MQYSDENTNDPHPRWRAVWKCLLVGFLSGLVVCIYRFIIERSNSFAVDVFAFLKDNPIFIILWIACAFGAAYLVYRLIKWEPSASGSGIPQVIGSVKLGHAMNWLRTLIVRFIGGTIGALFGLSVGREGPSVHIGALSAKSVSGKISDDELEERILITSGAAAGLSAAFNAPISGMVFALEEIHKSFSEYVLIAGLASAVAADIIASIVFGMTPVLDFMTIPDLDLGEYWWLIPCSILAGILGWLMNKGYMTVRTLFKKIPGWLALFIALMIALPVGLFLPEALGGGENAVKIAETAETGLLFIVTLLTVKIIFSFTSFGSGIPGGIFMPILAVGALGGSAIGLILVEFGMPAECIPNCAVLCMAGTLASSLRTPVTAVLLVTEMTASLIHLLPLAICVLVAFVISGIMKTRPIYRLLLNDIMKRDPSIGNNAGKTMSELISEHNNNTEN